MAYTGLNYSGDYFDQTYEPSIYSLFDYDPTPFVNFHENQNHSSPSFPEYTTAYSTFTPTEPESVQYYHNPNCYQVTVSSFTAHRSDQAPPQTDSVKLSGAKPGFNAPEFDEYDATPYGGGYDIVLTYGRPLPPSDITCYNPLGGPSKKKKVRFADEGDTKGSSEKVIKPPEKPRTQPSLPEIPPEPEKPQVPEIPWQPEPVRQIPSGYGLEAMDLCDSLFGFWPSHTRYYAERGSGCCGYGYGSDHREAAADYLFGSCDPYVERRDGGGSFGQPIHCYERRRREQPLSLAVQIEFDDHRVDDRNDSWSENFGIF